MIFQAEGIIAGDLHGFQLTLKSDNTFSMLNGLQRDNGLRIILHEPKKIPCLQNGGIHVKPHTKTMIGLSRVDIVRQGHPYESNCSTDWPQWVQGENIRRYPYSSQICTSLCIEEEMVRECGCSYKPYIEYYRGVHHVCNLNDFHDLQCLLETGLNLDAFYAKALSPANCHCPEECHETKYATEISTIQWPSDAYWSNLAKLHNYSYQGNLVSPDFVLGMLAMNRSEEVMEVREVVTGQLMEVRIFYDSLSVTKVEEVPKYNFESLLSSYGGACSLYLGISFVALFEFAELVIRLFIKYAFYRH